MTAPGPQKIVLVLERCRRRLFFGVKKRRVWSWYVAAGAFFCEKHVFGLGAVPQAPFLGGEKHDFLSDFRFGYLILFELGFIA